MSHVIHSSLLPSIMEAKLRAIRRRQAALAIARAVAVSLAVLLAAMLAAMLIDWTLTLFHTGVRTALSATTVVLGCAVFVVTAARPLVHALTFRGAAAAADGAAPQLEERWSTVTNFATGKHRPNSPTARAMLEQVTREAAALGRLVEPRRAARPATLRAALFALLGSAAALTAFLVLGWPHSSILLQRFLSPTANITATQLDATGDITAARGETIELTADLTGIPRDSATLTVQHESGVNDVFAIQAGDGTPASFAHALRVDASFRYQWSAGDGRTPWYRVTAIEYPDFDDIQFTVTAPEYVNRPPFEKSLIPRRVKVIQGSRLEVVMKPNQPLQRLELTFTNTDVATSAAAAADESALDRRTVSLTPDADGRYRFETQLLSDISFSPLLVNAHGLTNEHPTTCHIQVIPDKAPVARVLSPTQEMTVAVDETIEIAFEAHDDHGVAKVELVVYDDATDEGGTPKIVSVQEVPLDDQQLTQHVTGRTQLDLKKLPLEPGAKISYAIRVTDNRHPMVAQTMDEHSSNERSLGVSDTENVASLDRRSVQTDGGSEGSIAGEQSTAQPIAQQPASTSPPVAIARDAESTESPRVASEVTDAAGNDPRANATTGNVEESADLDDAQPEKYRENDAIRLAATPGSQPTAASEAVGLPMNDSQVVTPDSLPAETSQAENNSPTSESAAEETAANDTAGSDSASESNGEDSAAGDSPVRSSPSPRSPADETSQSDQSPAAATKNTDPQQRPGDSPNAEERTTSSSSDGRKGTREDGNEEQTVGTEDVNDNTENGAPTTIAASSTAGSGSVSANGSQSREAYMSLDAQQSESGQNAESTRRRLNITDRLTAVAAAEPREIDTKSIRERVVRIDKMLADAEAALHGLVDRQIPDSDRGEQFRRLDEQLGDIEKYIADLHEETKDDEFAFVGLQMVDIGRSNVTPARDEVFAGIRDRAGDERRAHEALQHVVRARELLAALLERYDRAARDRELAQSLDETVKIYEVYVEKMQQLLREARQNTNPLERKLAIVEVDQEYLDRYAEVLVLRREMLAEFAHMLADDPRLLARYLDLIKRRRTSMRDRLSELAARQNEVATELSGWLQVDESQREDLWMLLVETRLHATNNLAEDAAELAERVEKQLPLVLDPEHLSAAAVIDQARGIAKSARTISFDAPELIVPSEDESRPEATDQADQLVVQLRQFEAALDKLNFEYDDEEEVADYVRARFLESRTVADQAIEWWLVARALGAKSYTGLAEVDQRKLSIATELLRVEMLGMEDELEGDFQQQAEQSLPGEILSMVHELHYVMETIVFNQVAATFAMTRDQLPEAELQQAKALDGFAHAEELLDAIRRAVAAALDEYDVPDPSIADLIDPTLDDFLRQLEREPDIEAQLGIPNRPRNLRVLAEMMTWQQTGREMLDGASEAAAMRAREEITLQSAVAGQRPKPEEQPEGELTDEQREQLEKQFEMQDMLAKSLAKMLEKMKDPELPAEERQKLQQMADSMRRLQSELQQSSASRDWEELAQSDHAKEALQALASGKPLPDQQWNKLLSTLEDGLWQVHGKTPPADYRKAIEQYQDRIRQLMIVEE